jgi:hypothetical protein
MYSPTCDMLADHDWAELIIDCADPVPAALLPKTLEYDRALSAGLRNVHCAAALHDAMDTHVGYTERRVAPHPSPQNALIAALLQSESAVLLVKELVRSTTLTTFHLAKFWFSAAVMNILRMFATDAVFHAPMLTLNAFAEPNIWTMFDTDAVFHVPISWLNADVNKNIWAMLVTDAVFHAPISWLNADVNKNIRPMLVTVAVFHVPISWLNADAEKNISDMFDTRAVFHLPMLALKAVACEKRPAMFDTQAVFQPEMSALKTSAK